MADGVMMVVEDRLVGQIAYLRHTALFAPVEARSAAWHRMVAGHFLADA
jgi:hypothetical protein